MKPDAANEKMTALFRDLSKEFNGISECALDRDRIVFLSGGHYYALTTDRDEEADLRAFLETVSQTVEILGWEDHLLFQCQLTGNVRCKELLNAFTSG